MKPGETVGPYLILDLLGEGGMGQVYHARDTRLARDVALKRLTGSALSNEVARRRALREARAAAALSHPNIGAIYDVLDTPNGVVIVMEYVPGETLEARLRRGALPPEEALRIATEIVDALVEAHGHGVIHRDLKPANVYIAQNGRVKILDFGIARLADGQADGQARSEDLSTEAGHIIGTPAYMAPEQLTGGAGDDRTDIYGVGVVLYEMLTGRRRFAGVDFVSIALAVLGGRAPRVSEVAVHVPAELSAIVMRAMARNPAERFQTATQLRAALVEANRALSDAPTMRRTNPEAFGRWLRKRRLVTLAIVVGVICLALATGIWNQRRRAPPVSAHSSVIGVLPFRNQTGQHENDSFAVGLSEAVANRLSSVPSLRVLPLAETREAVQSTPDAVKVTRSLGAAFVVHGAVQRAHDMWNVDVFLVGADGGHRPAGRYSGNVSAPFDLHRRVVEGLTALLNQEGVLKAGAVPVPVPPTADQEAYAEYSQGRLFLERPDVPGNLDHAVRLFHSAIAKDSGFAQAHAAVGEAYWAQYRETNDSQWTTKATAAILEALRIDPAQPEVRLSLAVMYQGLGRRDDAIRELGEVLALQPDNDNAYRIRATIHASRGKWDAAVSEAQRAIALRPQYWRNHAELGDTLLRAGRLTEAMAAYHRIIELQPDSARGYQRLGTAMQAAGNLEGALENYQKATAIRPSWGAYSNVGTLHYWRGDYAKAVDAYERAIALAPNQPALYANRGDAWRRLGRTDRAVADYRNAIECVQKVLAVKQNDASSLAALALYQAKLGRYSTASATGDRAISLSPQDGEVLFARASVHALAGDKVAACTTLTKALAHGASPEVARRADELRTLKGCPVYDRLINVN